METKKIFTETPEDEQWRLLMHYTYSNNIKKFLENKGFNNPTDELIESISSSLLQAKEYFQASKTSSLQISPLLMYYGATNLLYGTVNLITGNYNIIKGHGMSLESGLNDKDKIGDILLYPESSQTGALSVLCNIFCSNCNILDSGELKIEQLFSTIPDLLNDYLDVYKNSKPHVIPVEILKRRNSTIERINPKYLKYFQKLNDIFVKIENFEENYLPPQYSSQMKYIIIRPKMVSEDIGLYSISGQKFLKLSYKKNGSLYNPSIEIVMLMALYSLSFISRYNPELWNPFVKNDISSEKLLIEKFLFYSRRLLPNLMLNHIYNKRILFVNEMQGIKDNSLHVTKDEVRSIIKEEYKKIRDKNRRDLP